MVKYFIFLYYCEGVMIKVPSILVMCFILIALMLLVAIPFILYLKEVRIKSRTARIIEIIGYYILFIMIIWEFGIKDILMRELYGLDIYLIEEKINIIFLWMRSVIAGENLAELIPEYYDIGSGKMYWESQLLFADVTELIMQLLSTVFIAVGRFQDLITKMDK